MMLADANVLSMPPLFRVLLCVDLSFDHEINCALLPCGHACVCNNCSQQLIAAKQSCPMCRQQIASYLKIYF
jgi:hypothetical protein